MAPLERYEHGGPLGMISSFEGMLLSDMTVSTRYVMMSKPKVDLFNGLGPARLFPNLMKVDLRSGGGDSNFAAIPSGSVKSPHARRKTILYGATVFRGHQQHEQPLLMDMVYLDWQIRLVEELNKLPADVVLKPHPQNPRTLGADSLRVCVTLPTFVRKADPRCRRNRLRLPTIDDLLGVFVQ